MDQFFVVL